MKIGELATKTGTQPETIRYYEREGLLPEAGRTESNYRVYGESHVARLAFIRHCRSLDMTLDEIRKLLRFKDAPQDNCDDVNTLLDEHIGHVAVRISELKNLQKELKALREQCGAAREAASCGILNGLETASRKSRTGDIVRGGGHLRGAHGKIGT
jgi:Cd(II)/Pb(II)-responsive transcriptional regulator